MNNITRNTEIKLNEWFALKAPSLPLSSKRLLTAIAPFIGIAIGICTLLSAWSLWSWANTTAIASNYADEFCNTYSGACGVPASRLTVWVWLGVILLAAEGLLYLYAFTGLKAYKNHGWNYLYYGALINAVYAAISLLGAYDVVGRFVCSALFSVIGLYLLFQVRGAYGQKPHGSPKGRAHIKRSAS